MNIADALEIVQQVIDQIALVIPLPVGIRDCGVVILKTLGATRSQVMRIFSVAFLALGVAAGFMGAILATVFSGWSLKRLLNAHFDFNWKAAARRAPEDPPLLLDDKVSLRPL